MAQESFAQAWSTVAELAPGRPAIVCGDRRLTFGELARRAGALAHAFFDAGLRPGAKVAIELLNSPEYLETFFAAQLLGCVPVNVNYRYVDHELAYLLDNSDAAALVYHDEFAATVANAVAARTSSAALACYQVHHAGDEAVPTGSRDYDDVVSTYLETPTWLPPHAPGVDDLIFIYTGGTTGAPKAVMWRSGDLAAALWQMARPGTEPPEARLTIERGRAAATVLPACPLMHGTGLFIALSTLSGGGTVVLIDTARLDAPAVWSAVERESVRVLTIVGDAFARPLLEALDREPDRWHLGGLSAITSSGVTWSPDNKRRLLEHLPGITLIDSLGASEGLMTRNEARSAADVRPAGFAASDRVVVVADDGTLCEPGDGRIGMLGVGGPIPLGYYKDDEKSARTFRVVGRWAALFDPRRLRPHRAGRRRHAARTRQRVHQHRRREGVPRGGGARAPCPPHGARLRRGRGRRRPVGRDGRRIGRAEQRRRLRRGRGGRALPGADRGVQVPEAVRCPRVARALARRQSRLHASAPHRDRGGRRRDVTVSARPCQRRRRP